MKIFYTCDNCGKPIDAIEVEELDEPKLGFDCLSSEERQELIKYDPGLNTIFVKSLCDECITTLGFAEEFSLGSGRFLH